MTLICKTCCQFEDKQSNPGLTCEECNDFFHISCLWSTSSGIPGDLAGDIFFIFTCSSCSKERREHFVRTKMTWLNIIYLTIYNLNSQSKNISNHGYFHYKTHISTFIDRNWEILFEPKFKQKKNWIGTIAGVLSVNNSILFRSGSSSLGESGWWKLQHNFSPAVAAHIIQEISQDKIKFKASKGSASSLDPTLFVEKVIEMGYERLLVDESESALVAPAPSKKRRVELEGYSSNTSNYDYADSDGRYEINEEASQHFPISSSLQLPTKDAGDSDAETSYAAYNYTETNIVTTIESETSLQSYQPLTNYESDYNSFYAYKQTNAIDHASDNEYEHKKVKSEDIKPKKKDEDKPVPIRRETMFSKELNSIDMPWLPERQKEAEASVSDNKVKDKVDINKADINKAEINKVKKPVELVELSEYEEVQLLKQIETLIPKVCDVSKKAELRMLKSKLALRRLKRHKHLPVFDLEKTVKVLAGYMVEEQRITNNVERVLDRFQRSYLMDNLCGTVASTNYGTLLLSRIEPVTFQSPYSGAVLKPYIRRDLTSKPLWRQLMDELLRKTNSKTLCYSPPSGAPLDFSYVRPQHVAAVNSLCALHFWPGVDLTEALQYPEYSCVVTYRKLVVACAFLVPDAGNNEAYISFVLTRPEWRGAGIGTFMIYHLLQTCTGKDVTLHVSPTNPAIFLYQKFGFKVEELIQDFYEKYYDIDYKGCRHALFLRLVR